MTHMTATHTAWRPVGSCSTKSERDRVLREIGRRLEPDRTTIEPGIVTTTATLPGMLPVRNHKSPEQPGLSEKIRETGVRNRRRKAILAAAAGAAIIAASGCKQATPARSDVCFVPREPAIEDAMGIQDVEKDHQGDGEPVIRAGVNPYL
ncbi:TPA: hypothetical protein HA238_02020 [Candidatus Micrarchaeota archaeon]|nr:hypothetical protein [Candidatus Micrarchaeota archaeon]